MMSKQGAPINKPFALPPPNDNANTEDNLKQLNYFIVDLCQKTNLKPNLSADQRAGFKSLLDKKDQMSFSVSVKGGEFVILPKQSRKDLTNHHLSNTGGVYKFVEPTRKY